MRSGSAASPADPVAHGDGAPRGLTERDGARRVLVFRAWSGPSDMNRRVAGLLGIYYAESPLVDRAAMRDHVRAAHGEGTYKVVVQTKAARQWRYDSCETLVLRGDPAG